LSGQADYLDTYRAKTDVVEARGAAGTGTTAAKVELLRICQARKRPHFALFGRRNLAKCDIGGLEYLHPKRAVLLP
jgi:hypothetical protein